ncbi:tRNA-intron lyase [Geoglobus sp.]
MKGSLEDGRVLVDFSQRLLSRKFGRRRGEKIELLPEEAAYLSGKGSVEVYIGGKVVAFDELLSLGDPIKYFVFEDLRERGMRVDFRELDGYVPVSENHIFSVKDLESFCGKRLAVVDSEAEITYFLVEKFSETGKHVEELKEFRARFANGFFVTDYSDLYRKYFYGVKKGSRVILSVFEALYLMEKGLLSADVGIRETWEYGLRHVPNFEKRYLIYKDLRERKFMVKTGFKFGSDYRVYEYVRSVSELKHSKYLVKLREKVSMMELACDVRLGSAVNKIVLYPLFAGDTLEYIVVRRVKM